MRFRRTLAVAVLSGGLLVGAPVAHGDDRITAAPQVTVTRLAAGGYRASWTPVGGARGYRVYLEAPVGRAQDGGGYLVEGTRMAEVAAVSAGRRAIRIRDRLTAEVNANGSSLKIGVAAYNDAGTGPQGQRRAGCADGYFVAARGSGQNPKGDADNNYAYGLGLRAYRTYEDARARLGLSHSMFQANMVNYPAVTINAAAINWSRYRRSVEAGVATAATQVASIVNQCPQARIVMFGYSQGGHVAGNAFNTLGTEQKAHVMAMQLFADAVRNGLDPGIQYRPVSDAGHGIVGTRSRFTGLTDRLQVSSWCLPKDDICSVDRLPTTIHGGEYACYEKWAAQALAARARNTGWVPAANVTHPTCVMAT